MRRAGVPIRPHPAPGHSTSSAAPFPSTSGFPPPAAPSPFSPPSSTPTDALKPAYQWRDTVLPGFPCRAEFPLPTQTRWDTMMVDGVLIEFVEQFCELESGIRLALGGAERSSEESRRASAEALRAGVLKKLSAEHGISSSNFHLKVSGDPRPFLELSGTGAKGGQVIRLRAASSDSMLMWASISGPPQWAGDGEPQRFFGSVDFGWCEQGRADEARLWLAASKHFASSHRGTSVASQSPAPATANPMPPFRVPRTFDDFFNDNSMTNLFGNESEGGVFAGTPDILDRGDEIRKHLIESRNRQLASSAQRAIGAHGNPLGNEYLSPRVGQSDKGDPIKVYHSQRLPMIGVDFTLDRTRRQLTAIGPVYLRGTVHRVLAREGFAIAGLNVAEEHGAIRGIQLMFMQVKGAGFDANEAYWSEWFGFPPDDESLAVKLGGDGGPVYGLYYFERGSVLCGLGLVVEKAR